MLRCVLGLWLLFCGFVCWGYCFGFEFCFAGWIGLFVGFVLIVLVWVASLVMMCRFIVVVDCQMIVCL